MKALLSLLFCCITPALHAFSWQDLWSTKDQQALAKMVQHRPKEAQFQRPDWQATASYRAGLYEQAAAQFAALSGEKAAYNQGNALAYLGHYKEAIKAYDNVLATNPTDRDALFNKQLLQSLLKQQQSSNNNKKNTQSPSDKQDPPQKSNPEQKQPTPQSTSTNQQPPKEPSKTPESTENKQNSANPTPQAPNPPKKSDTTQEAHEKEDRRAKEQWLQLIPEDPGGLLREKFLRDHIRRQQGWMP